MVEIQESSSIRSQSYLTISTSSSLFKYDLFVKYCTPQNDVDSKLPIGAFVLDASQQRKEADRQTQWPYHTKCLLHNKLRSCFQFEPNYTVLTGHREKHRS